MTAFRRFHRDRQGIAAVEFALVAPVFLLIVAGIVAYGMYFAIQVAVTEAAAEGARLSVAGLTATERATLANQAAAAVINSYKPMLTAASATIIAAPSPGNALLFTVTVSYPYTNFFPVMAPLVGTPTATITVSNGGY